MLSNCIVTRPNGSSYGCCCLSHERDQQMLLAGMIDQVLKLSRLSVAAPSIARSKLAEFLVF